MDDRQTRCAEREGRILSLTPKFPGNAKELFLRLRRELLQAVETEALANSPGDVFRCLRFSDDHREIVGGAKNFNRDPNLDHFARRDGFWFDFAITLAQPQISPVTVVAYDFELRFPDNNGFVRFDLNPPGHPNADESMRCHVHPGHDDVRVPAPLLGPLELLDVFLHEVRFRARQRQ